ncbi:MAG: hypothetical protein BHW58_04865 [Azospirillum sp. 51_20]|nr:MAG: hypothetical protein BHW58_04865 [Azospirillum sp. 51_20]
MSVCKKKAAFCEPPVDKKSVPCGERAFFYDSDVCTGGRMRKFPRGRKACETLEPGEPVRNG